MSRIIDAFTKLLQYRRISDRRIRLIWWSALVGLVILFASTDWSVFLPIWVIANVATLLRVIFWCLIHPKLFFKLREAREKAIKWAIWLTLFSALLLFSGGYRLLVQINWFASTSPEHIANHPAGLVFVILLILCPIIGLFFLLPFALLGMATGTFTGRATPDIEKYARLGVSAWMWSALLAIAWGLLPNRRLGLLLLELTLSGLPILTLLLCRFGLRSYILDKTPTRLAISLSELLFVRRWHWQGKNYAKDYQWDMRGAALGLFSAMIVLLIPQTVIAPMQAIALSSLIQLQSSISESGPHHMRVVRTRNRIVLLEMDPVTRHSALTDRSESAIQRDMIRALQQLGTWKIVLPLPFLHTDSLRFAASPHSLNSDLTTPDTAELKRSAKDIPALATAVHTAGNVYLELPAPASSEMERLFPILAYSEDEAASDNQLAMDKGINENRTNSTLNAGPNPKVNILKRAARAVSTDTPSGGPPGYLPTIPAQWNKIVPLPILLAASRSQIEAGSRVSKEKERKFGLAQVGNEGAIVNFVGEGPNRDFTHITYSALMRNEPLYAQVLDPTHDDAPVLKWVYPRDLVKDRIVFLDSLTRPMATTPGGVMTRSEVLAYATATLLSGEPIRRAPRPVLTWLTLLLGLLIGHLCMRREPVDALLRIALPVLGAALCSLLFFTIDGLWLDPVTLLVTITAALALVSQFSFTQERHARERTRALFQRFVAPEQVDIWLAMPKDSLGLGGKRQTVCVLFADVRNFTPFAERNEADKVIEVINRYMSVLTEALHTHGGILDKYTGDGLMAWFPIGATPYKKTAPDVQAGIKQAIRAALAMRDAAIKVSTLLPPEERLDIGIGLHYGDAVVGLIGNEKLQVNWTALGHTVVVSARLQTIAAGGQVIISEQMHTVIEGIFHVSASEPVTVKGLSIPVRPYLVLGEKMLVENAEETLIHDLSIQANNQQS